MKKIYGFLGAFALLSIAACSSDEPLVNNGGYNGGDDGRMVYINAMIQTPSIGGRSATDTIGDSNSNGSSNSGNSNTDDPDNATSGSDVEIGTSAENTVRSMVLVITDKNDRYLHHVVATGMTRPDQQKFVYTSTTRIPYSVLTEAYGKDGLFSKIASGTKPMHLYAFCNFTNNLLTQFNEYQAKVQATALTARNDTLLTEWRDFQGNVHEAASMAGQTPQSTNSIWSENSFLMSNASVYNSTFPATIEEWDEYADDRHPLQLTGSQLGSGPIKVERLAARLDFRDASPNGDLRYPIIEPNSNLNLFSVRLSRMVLVNMSNNFYYLRRVSDDGLNNNAIYAGAEAPDMNGNYNYVVDADANDKAKTTDGYAGSPGINVKNAGDHFNFPLFSENTTDEQVHYNNMYGTYGWYISNVEDVLKGREDNWDGKKGGQDIDYRVWRYITENTIPQVDQQKTIQSTGIIFKAAIESGSEEAIKSALEQGLVSPILVAALDAVNPDPKKNPNWDKTVKPTLPKDFDDEEGNPTPLPAIYSFQNDLYAGVADIVRAAKADGNGGSLYFAVDQILKNWYIKDTSDATNGKKFVYCTGSDVPSADDLKIKKDDEGHDIEPKAVQLNVIIADEILNHTEVTDGSKDYSTGYEINFKDETLDKNDSLAPFDNSRFIELAPAMEITTFIPTNDDEEGWGYYCYYFYWLRHNDNGATGKMGTMEFASVRNNVYKLAVTKINTIGHPRDTRRDPDPVKPGDPDEEPERSIEVEVDVLPWVVRVNDIEFL